MKTIDDAAKEYANSFVDNDYTIETEAAVKFGVELAQRWIPVEKELPEIRSYCLVKLSDETTLFAQFTVFGNWDVFWAGGRSTETSTRPVTHWRPIELK